jgi:hypothetical protein
MTPTSQSSVPRKMPIPIVFDFVCDYEATLPFLDDNYEKFLSYVGVNMVRNERVMARYELFSSVRISVK